MKILCALWGGILTLTTLALVPNLGGQASNPGCQTASPCAPLASPAFTGGITVTGVIGGTSDIFSGASGAIYFNGRTQMLSGSNGNFELTNQARTGFSNLQFGCTAATCPELKVSGNTIGITNADGTVGLFASLPVCISGLAGQMAWVTDSTSSTFGGTIAGSGANKVLGICDGTNWTVH